MCDICEGRVTREEFEENIDGHIRRVGWAMTYVHDAEPADCFVYSIGLTLKGHPELVVRGLPRDHMEGILASICPSVVAGTDVLGDGHTARLGEWDFLIQWMGGTPGILSGAVNRYGTAVRALQIVQDPNGERLSTARLN